MASTPKFMAGIMRDQVDLQKFWHAHRTEELALCTLIRKEGSGYRLPGAKKIIPRHGEACGLLSGGCLEADIEKTARDGWNAMPFIRSFSTLSEEDRLLGYQTGCAGVITLLFERVPPDAEPALYIPFGEAPRAAGVTVSLRPEQLGQRAFSDRPAAAETVFFDPWVEPVRLYILGAGIDARPYAELAPLLGWPVHFIDYRQAHEKNAGFSVRILAIDAIARHVPDGEKTAVVLMTHNYNADMEILKQLSGRSLGYLGYLGCLGPRARYEQMKAELLAQQSAINPAWEKIVHAPAGLFTGRSPDAIAFSILAEIQSLLVSDAA